MAKYYGVVGNRDHIKLRGEKRPFWEFLDEAPDGWLCSLYYRRSDVPDDRPRIWDCGAWSYKAMDAPVLLGHLVTPEYIRDLYRELAHPFDHCIAPDHMLIPGLGDLNARRRFNRENGERFIDLCGNDDFIPMAAVHGESVGERVDRAGELVEYGYTALALGGLAGQASRRAACVEAVEAVRAAFPGVWLHVLGLSAPSYAREWARIEVDSFDGASHFKQAFTAGKFYHFDGVDLKFYKAAREGEPVTAPRCDCLACTLLISDGVDTRRYGSNESNMGRAAHNLNHLMRAIGVAVAGPWAVEPGQAGLFEAAA